MDHATEPPQYTPPTITVIGGVHEFTQDHHIKWLGQSDGFTFIVPITTISF